MVVSSLTPLQCFDIHVHLVAFSEIESFYQRFNVPSIDAVRSTKIFNAIVIVLTLVHPPASHEHERHDVVGILSPSFALGDWAFTSTPCCDVPMCVLLECAFSSAAAFATIDFAIVIFSSAVFSTTVSLLMPVGLRHSPQRHSLTLLSP